MDCISEQDLDEMNIEIIRNTLYKVRYSCTLIRYTCYTDQVHLLHCLNMLFSLFRNIGNKGVVLHDEVHESVNRNVPISLILSSEIPGNGLLPCLF